jgi:hypothetical protein
MNTHKIAFGIATLAFFATTSSVFLSAGCSSSSSPPPTQRDASTEEDSSTTKHDSGKPPEKDAGHGKKDAEPTEAGEEGGEEDAGDGGETMDGPADTGPACESDATTCNSCSATDLYNACSTFTKYCVPFDKTRVPAAGVGKL